MVDLGQKRTQLKIDIYKVWCQKCNKKSWIKPPFTFGKLPMTKSFLQFKRRVDESLHPENLKQLFDIHAIPEITQVRAVLDNIDSKQFSPVFKDVF